MEKILAVVSVDRTFKIETVQCTKIGTDPVTFSVIREGNPAFEMTFKTEWVALCDTESGAQEFIRERLNAQVVKAKQKYITAEQRYVKSIQDVKAMEILFKGDNQDEGSHAG